MRRRINKRIRTCGGCRTPNNKNPLSPPYDMVLLTKEKRTKRGTTWKDNDMVEVNVHYHVNKRCLKKTNFDTNTVVISPSLDLKEIHYIHFHQHGIVF